MFSFSFTEWHNLLKLKKKVCPPTLALPYTCPPLTIKVVKIRSTTKVTAWEIKSGEAKPLGCHQNVTAAVTDGTSVMRFTIFENLASQVKEGGTYIIKNYGCSRYGGQALLSRHSTIIFKSLKQVHTTPDLEEQACLLLSPASTPTTHKSISTDTAGLLTVQGFITSVSFWGSSGGIIQL